MLLIKYFSMHRLVWIEPETQGQVCTTACTFQPLLTLPSIASSSKLILINLCLKREDRGLS